MAESTFGDFGNWSDRLFVQANPQLSLPADFSMSDLVEKLRAAHIDPIGIVTHKVVHEYIRFCIITHISRFRDTLQSAKATVASAALPPIAVYGNLGGASPGLTGQDPLSNALAQVADVVCHIQIFRFVGPRARAVLTEKCAQNDRCGSRRGILSCSTPRQHTAHCHSTSHYQAMATRRTLARGAR